MLKTTLLIVSISIFLLILLSNMWVYFNARNKTASADDVSPHQVAIIFGAGLWGDGTPTPVLRDRVETAANLFFKGKVDVLLMSGDNRFIDYNEPAAMKNYALDLGVPEDHIVLDFAGRRTYDTCYRANAIFGLEKAILITQEFHLPRALYLCEKLGVESTGVVANRRKYSQHLKLYWKFREMVATTVAIWEIHVTKPLPVLGEPEPIFFPKKTNGNLGE